jgi:tetratricopeptide (TPR) repeat protein
VQDAKEVVKHFVELRPDNPQGYFQLGIVNRMLKDNNGALTAFNKALEIDPNSMDAFSQVVSILVSQRHFSAALAKCDEQLELLKNSKIHVAVISTLKGLVYRAQKMDQKAESEFKAAIAADENYLRPYYELAKLYLQRSELDRAIEQYNSALAQNPNQARPHMLLGTLYDEQKKYGLSEQHYREALKINPEFAPAANNLAYLLAENSKDINEAFNYARIAKEKLPNDPGVINTLGWVYYKKGLYDSAIAELRDAQEKTQDNAMINYHLGMAYYKADQKAKAKAVLERVLAIDPNFEKAREVRQVLEKL